MAAPVNEDWAGVDSPLASVVRDQTQRCLAVYRDDSNRIDEDVNTEVAASEVGYHGRQLFELIQNGADAMAGSQGGRIEVVLTDKVLYVANEGRPFDAAGVEAVMAARIGRKRSELEIGRFGLGFKSVVALSEGPQVISRTGSFQFSRFWSEDQIREIAPHKSRYPLLRLAEPFDPHALFDEDDVLRSMTLWAATIVRLPLKEAAPGSADNRAQVLLRGALSKFPAEFLLFVPHVGRLSLRDRAEGSDRTVLVDVGESGDIILSDGDERAAWRVFKDTFEPSGLAREDAGEAARRDQVTLHWAVPSSGINRDGAFWAFFPTGWKTTLSGIVNAPWKLSDDRRTIIEGEFNSEILTERLPLLVAGSLELLEDRVDPGAVLDVLPARGLESRNHADGELNEPVFETLRGHRCLPLLDGGLGHPAGLLLAPKGLSEDMREAWLSCGHVTGPWVHPSVDRSPERRHKAERLIHGGGRVASVSEWLEAVSAPGTPESSAVALRLAAMLVKESPSLDHDVRTSSIVLLEDGRLAEPRPGALFLRSSVTDGDHSFVHPDVVSQPNVAQALTDLGIHEFDQGGHLHSALLRRPIDWFEVWELSRAVEASDAERVIRDALPEPLTRVRVRSAAGQWMALDMGFLGGPIIPSDGSRDAAYLIDPAFHGADEELLARLGAVRSPIPGERAQQGADEEWLDEYEEALVEGFYEKLAPTRPRRELMRVTGGKPTWPLALLPLLSDEGRASLTEAAIALGPSNPWTVRHATNDDYRSHRSDDGPVEWWLKRHGLLRTAAGQLPPASVLARADRSDSTDVLPVAAVDDEWSRRLGLVTHPSELPPSAWERLQEAAGRWSDERRRARAYAVMCSHVAAPSQLVVGDGGRARGVPATEVAVSCIEDEWRTLVVQGVPAIVVPSPEMKRDLISNWGLADGTEQLQVELAVEPAGEPAQLLDWFPGLRPYLDLDQSHLLVQPASAISLLMASPSGQLERPVRSHFADGCVYVTSTEPSAECLRLVSDVLGLELDGRTIEAVLDRRRRDHVRALKARIRRASTDAERLVEAVGADDLRRSLPEPAITAVQAERGRALTDLEIAEMALAVYGLSVLKNYREVLAARGLDPPYQWTGGAAARRFVSELGFPSTYAGFAGDTRAALVDVEGPVQLPPLHPFQAVVAGNVRELVRGERDPRGMLVLPTGAGKTRVAVQALVDEVRDHRLTGSVVWIAQTDELCEQAVQTWKAVWRSFGPDRVLRIGRFWASNDAGPEPEHFHLVVATPDKLLSVAKRDEYGWLSDAAVVVVDEAHQSITPMYTDVLTWLGRARRGNTPQRPLIGLTATPFRNLNAVESDRLVKRYGGRRLDQGAFAGDPYDQLQRMGVLAYVDHELLDGIEVSFSEAEKDEMKKLSRVPASVQTRLGANVKRNREIVESICARPEDHNTLVFATTVENSRALAAHLTMRGVPAVSISAQTDPAARRHYVEEFRAGRIRVITNYNVLSQGFDVPAVRAVYVARPTLSRNLYQQMIGRGLRGPLNGGSERVTIVNIADNFAEYGETLAFDHFKYLWDGSGGA
jgi:superfamily II DNA or RNA helicase